VGLLVLADRPAAPTTGDLLLLGAVGIAILGIDLVLYTLLTVAPVAIIYPILASNAAVVTLLAVLVMGERLSPVQLTGVALVTAGIFLIAWRRTPAEAPIAGLAEEALSGAALLAGPGRSSAPAPKDASLRVIAAAVAITVAAGVLLFIVADATRRLGWYQPVLIDRTAQALVIGALLLAGHPPRSHLRGHPRRWWLVLAVMGVLNAAGSAFYGAGIQYSSTALTATAASTFAAVPVILGIVLLGERPQRHQLAGIVGAITGIVLLSS
jgi:drug/metabolite transporter (DMT)-like permease